MEHMFPALFARASHPVVAGDAIFSAMDIVGIEGAKLDSAGLMRYRSKRDLLKYIESSSVKSTTTKSRDVGKDHCLPDNNPGEPR